MSATTATEKPCTRCEQVKPLDAFWRSPTGKHGRASRCKECQTECDQTSGQRSARYRKETGPTTVAMLVVPEVDTAWRAGAACLKHPNAADWFASPEAKAGNNGRRRPNAAEAAAIAVCESCPVRAECLEAWMLNPTRYGVWAGMLPEELARLRRQRRIKGAAS